MNHTSYYLNLMISNIINNLKNDYFFESFRFDILNYSDRIYKV